MHLHIVHFPLMYLLLIIIISSSSVVGLLDSLSIHDVDQSIASLQNTVREEIQQRHQDIDLLQVSFWTIILVMHNCGNHALEIHVNRM